MTHQKSELYFLLILFVGILVLTLFIFKPFLYALILAVVFATVFEPLHKKILNITRQRKGLAALLATASVLVIVVAPIAFLGVQIFQEATALYSSLVIGGGTIDLFRGAENIINGLKRFLPIPVEFPVDINQYVKPGLNWLLQHIGSLFSNIAKALFGAFIFLVALYYLFKDGKRLKETAVVVSPLRDIHGEAILNKLALAINSIVKGTFAVVLVQGMLTAVGFFIFGVPNAALWGSVATIAALIPGIGMALVFLPAILYLYFNAGAFLAVGLLVWGMTAVGLVDNFLGPKLVERGMRLHPFLILLSVLGGIGLFGPFGLLLGPLVLSLLFACFDIYLLIRKEHESNLT